jgi:hypothetical protein
MRAYIAHPRERDPISGAESRRREAAVEFAYASVGLEGFKPSESAEHFAREFIEGGISLADFIKVKPDAEQDHNQ